MGQLTPLTSSLPWAAHHSDPLGLAGLPQVSLSLLGGGPQRAHAKNRGAGHCGEPISGPAWCSLSAQRPESELWARGHNEHLFLGMEEKAGWGCGAGTFSWIFPASLSPAKASEPKGSFGSEVARLRWAWRWAGWGRSLWDLSESQREDLDHFVLGGLPVQSYKACGEYVLNVYRSKLVLLPCTGAQRGIIVLLMWWWLYKIDASPVTVTDSFRRPGWGTGLTPVRVFSPPLSVLLLRHIPSLQVMLKFKFVGSWSIGGRGSP